MDTHHLLHLEGRPQQGARTVTITDPYDGSPVGSCHVGDAGHVDRAIAFAHARAHDLARVPLHHRADILARVAQLLDRDREVLAQLIRREAGKPITLARGEVQRGVETFTCAAAEARRMDGEALPLDTLPRGEGRFGIVRRFPVGVVAAISPYNFPLNLVAHKVAPAMAAGCPVVLKPASQAPLTALHLARLCDEAGLAEGGLQVIPCSRGDADALVTDPRVALLTFTGSPEVGWAMKARAGKKRVVLELGGNAAAVVFPDADLSRAIPALRAGAFGYAGQVCISVQRILVPRQGLRDFVDAFAASATEAALSGNPADERVINGPLIDDANARRVLDWTREAEQAGARVHCGGTRDGNVVHPVVLTDTPTHARAYADEVFGPLVNVEPFDGVEDAVARINRGRFGLQAGVFTRDISTLWRMYESLEVGGVIHDDVPTFRSDQFPYGGVKDSGLGREGVRYAMEDMTERRVLVLRP